jgi:hypothetical protein
MAINPEMVTSVLVSATLDAALKVVALFRGLTSSTHAFGDFASGQQNQLPRHSSSAAGVTGAPVSVSEKLPPTKRQENILVLLPPNIDLLDYQNSLSFRLPTKPKKNRPELRSAIEPGSGAETGAGVT